MEESYIKKLLETGNEEVRLTEKQAKIIISAIEIFSEKGYASTSTSEIAKRAGVAEGTIFRHYPTKKDLLLAIVTPGITKLAVPFFAAYFIKDVFEKDYGEFEGLLHKLISNRLEFVRENIPLVKILLQEIAFHEEIQQSFQQVFQADVYPKFRGIISHFQQQGKLEEYPIPSVIRFIISNVLGFIITRFIVLPDNDWDEDAEVDRLIAMIMKGLEKV